MNAEQGKDRIAVVLLHGVGEQRPMETLRRFVKGIFGEPGRSKPDRLSANFEVRRLNLFKPKDIDVEVDCYELYWAHHMQGSKFVHITKWLRRLSSTKPTELKKMAAHLDKELYINIRIRVLLAALMIAAIVVGIVFMLNMWERSDTWTGTLVVTIVSIGGSLAWWWANDLMVSVVGDAARYLDNAPANVGIRQAIRTECVRFLEELNNSEDPCYSRIVVVGHSLGSVIAYDALKLMWAKMDPHVAVPDSAETNKLLDRLYEDCLPEGKSAPAPQRDLFNKALAADKTLWKISDLITVGSPLTHAPVLFAESNSDFEQLREQRELPTCPPQRDEPKKGEPKRYCGWKENLDFKFHHAALFALVEWTNIYFPNDPIGGPLKCIFGFGICDVPLSDAPTGKWSDHTRYWEAESGAGSSHFKWVVQGLLTKHL